MKNLKFFDLSGKVAIVTGGGSGLGLSFCEALAEAGADIVQADIVADQPHCLEACATVEKHGVRAIPVKCNVSDPDDVDNLVETTLKEFGKIDILVNSAGITGDSVLAVDMSVKNWDRVLTVDLKGTFLCCRAVAKEMTKRKEGKIINISSASSFKAMVGMAAYATAKAGTIMLTKTLALELARHNIQVNALSPGFFATPLNRSYFETEAGQKLIKSWPMRRPGNPEELKGIIIYLASAASSFTTGSEFVIDGGMWL